MHLPKRGCDVDGYRQASYRSLLIVVVLVIVAMVVIFLVASWGLNALNAPGVENLNDPGLPGIDR